MKLDFFLSRVRYLAIALPLFALSSTVHAGCSSAPNGLYYTQYGSERGFQRPSIIDDGTGCEVYRTGYGGYGGYYGPCNDDDGYGYGGYDGSGYGGYSGP